MWVWQDDPKDSELSKAKWQLIGDVIKFLEDDKDGDGKITVDIDILLRYIKIIFTAQNYFILKGLKTDTGTTLTSATPVNLTIAPKV